MEPPPSPESTAPDAPPSFHSGAASGDGIDPNPEPPEAAPAPPRPLPPTSPPSGVRHVVPGGGGRLAGNGSHTRHAPYAPPISHNKRGVTAAEALATELHREIALREELERRLARAEGELSHHQAAAETPAAPPAPDPAELAAERSHHQETARRLEDAEHHWRNTEADLRDAESRLRDAESQLREATVRLHAAEARAAELEADALGRAAAAATEPPPAPPRPAYGEGRHGQSEQRLAYLMTSSPLGFFDDDYVADTTYYSPACMEMLGYRADELPLDRQMFFELLHPDDRTIRWLTDREPVEGGVNRFSQHFRLRHKDGGYRWIESTGTEFKDPVGNRLRAMGFYRDFTRRKVLEESLQQSEERLNLLVTSSPLGFFDTGGPGGQPYYSPLWKSMLGYGPDELPDLRDSWLDLVHPDDLAAVLGVHTRRDDEADRQPFSHALRLRHKDGVYRWVQASGLDFFAPDGRPSRSLGFHGDIHALKVAEEELAHEKEALGVTLDSISDGVIAVDMEGHVTYLNAAAANLCGLSLEEASGLPIEEFYRRAGAQTRRQADNPVRAVLASGMRAAPHDPAHLTGAGRPEKVIADNAAPVSDRTGRTVGAVLVFHDITDRHRAAEELQKAGRIESLGVLAGGIAHDFNNLLTSILGNLSVARSGGDLPMRALDSLGRAEKACWRARDLTGQLLTFAKGGDPVRALLHLPDVIEGAVRNATGGSAVHPSFQFTPDLPPVEADQGQIVQVLHNLAHNAVQAMPGGGKLHISADLIHSPQGLAAIEEVHQPANAYVEIKVSDSGTGIAPEHLAKIFDPFFSTRTNGTGLGLAIAYSIVRKHDGVIRVDSRTGVGSTFTVYLPVSPTVSLPTVPAPSKPEERRTGGRVLFMDDDPDIRDLAGAILDLIGYEPTLTAEGAETLVEYSAARAASQPYAAVILDLTIPGGMGGKETIRRLREIDPDVRAIVSSGYSNDAVIADFRAHGFMAMVAKPYRMEDLARALMTAITGEGFVLSLAEDVPPPAVPAP